MKLNKKGFMLAEVVITSSVVAVILVTIYIGINRMNNAYDKRNRYYDIDAQQVAMEVNDLLKRNYTAIDIFNDYNKDYISLITIEEDNEIGYDEILNIYNKKFKTPPKVYLVNNEQGFKDLKKEQSNNLFKDYTDYYINKYKDDLSSYSYFVVVELQKKDENDCYYYTLKVKE